MPTRTKFPFPPPDFKPREASAAELRKYGLPQRPDGRYQEELLEAWLRLFEEPLTFRRPGLKPPFVPPLTQNIRQILPYRTRVEDSPNWCGASIVPHGGQQLVQIFGEWTVPKPELPPAVDRGPAGKSNSYHCVVWIGLDGNRRYLNSSLPQIGTEQVLTVDANGRESREYFVWFQWWARNQVKLRREKLTRLTIDAGVSVMAMIWVIDPHHVVVVFRTFAPRNEITILVRRATEVALPGGTITPAISGAMAEWILERPQTLDLVGAKLQRFPKYDPVKFQHCVAGTAPRAGLPTAEETLAGSRLLRLFEVPETSHPCTRFISMPTRISTTSVKIHYGGFSDSNLS
jgi:hypothetical protein